MAIVTGRLLYVKIALLDILRCKNLPEVLAVCALYVFLELRPKATFLPGTML
jgi:hypothetical protein